MTNTPSGSERAEVELSEPIKYFFDALAAADAASRLSLYASAPVPLTPDDVARARVTHREISGWLALRLEAGPPGQALPTLDEAVRRLHAGDATLADVAAWLMTPSTAIVVPDALFASLERALAVALCGGAPRCVGRCSRALALLQLLVVDPQQPCQLWEKLAERFRSETAPWRALVETIENDCAIARDPWLRVAAANFWNNSGTEMPGRIALTSLLTTAIKTDPSPVMTALRAHASTAPLADSLADVLSFLIYDQFASHPLVERLRRIANYGGRIAELRGLEPPEGLDQWVFAAARRGHAELARLAAWLLHSHERMPADQLCRFVLRAPHAEDLALLAEHAPSEKARTGMLALAKAVRLLPDELADGFVRLFLLGPRDTEGLELCRRHAEALRQAAPTMESPFRELATTLLSLYEDIDHDVARGAPAWDAVVVRARELAEQCGDEPLDGDGLDAVAAAAALPALDERALIHADDSFDALPPEQRLFAAALILRGLTPELARWRTRVEERLIHATIHAEAAPLFPRAIATIDDLLRRGGVAYHRAELLRFKAQLRAAGESPEEREEAARLYRQAADEARTAGLIRSRIHSITALVRLVLLSERHGDPWSRGLAGDGPRELDGLEEDARQFGMLPELYEARAALARHSHDFGASAQWYREALKFCDEREHPAMCADLRCHLAETLLFTDDPHLLAEAEEHARAALRLLRDDRGPASLALARAVLGMVLLHRTDKASDEALTLLEEVIRVPPASRGVTSPGQIRLSLADAYRRAGRTREAETQVRRIFEEHQDERDFSLLLSALFLGIHVAPEGGLGDAERRVQRLLERFPAEPERTLIQLTHALLFPERYELDKTLSWATAYIRREVPRHGNVEHALLTFVFAAAPRLPGEFLRLCLERGFVPADEWHTRAKLLLALNDRERLLALCNEVLTDALQPQVRRTALLYRLQALPDDDPTIATNLAEIEVLFDDGPDEPYQRAELAQMLYRHARGELPALARAWRHIERAAPRLTASPVAESVWRLQAAIRSAQLNGLGPVSGTEQVELATWFRQRLPLPEHEVVQLRLAVVRQLLFVGPLIHPDVTSLALYFLARLITPEAEPLSRRMAWIAQEQRKPGTSEPLRAAGETPVRFPFDDAPAWLIDLVVRGSTDRRVQLDEVSVQWVHTATRVRPDRAEVLLGWLVQRPTGELADLAQMLESLCLDSKRRIVPSQLLELLAALPSPGFALRRLQVQLLAASFDRSGAYTAAASALLAAAATPAERAEALFFKGVERLDASRYHRAVKAPGPDPIYEARQIFADAAEMARDQPLSPELAFSILVSAGNSHRDGTAPDLERALNFYAAARERGAPDAHSHAKLCKVTADALVKRDNLGDLDRADQLLDEALTIRHSGWLRAETLLSVVEATLAREDRPWVSRLRVALQRLAEAQGHDDGRNREAIARRRRHLAKRLLAERPKDSDATAVLAEVTALLGDEAEQRARPADVLDHTKRSDLESVVELMRHPAAVELWKFVRPLMALRQPGAERRPPAELLADVKANLAELDARGDALSPGAWLAKAQLLAFLAEHDASATPAAVLAADRAEREIEAIEEPRVRAFLFSELVHLWSPESHASHPVRDFRRAVSLAERALEWVSPGETLYQDLAGYRARATRYRTDGDVRQHLQRAEELYAALLRELAATGDRRAEQMAVNLEEVRSALQHGHEGEHLRQSVAAARRAAEGEQVTMMNRIALARDLTLLGSRTSEPEGSRLLAEAEGHWSALPWNRMSKAEFESADNYRAICTAERCRRGGDLPGALAVWRARLERIDRDAAPLAWAMAAHNLADNLARSDDEDHAGEAFRLGRAALQIRSASGDLIHHWETCQTLGDAAAVLLRRGAEDLVGLTTESLIELSMEFLHSSLDAAVKLGGGDRRFKAAFRLALIARFIESASRRVELLEQAWAHIDAARPFLLSDQDAAARETALAQDVALQLAKDLTQQGPIGVGAGVRFVFEGERARLVLRWILRAVGGAQRRLAARTRRPREVDAETWVRWLQAVQGADPVEIGRCLAQIREQAPDFLSASPDQRGVEQWLRNQEAPAAVIPILTRDGLLTAVLEPGAPLRITLALLTTPAPPASEPELAASMVEGGRWSAAYRNTLEWARRTVVAPLERLFAGELRSLLWCPPDVLRMLAPATLWPGIAVTCVADPCVRAAASDRIGGATALLVADPDVPKRRIPGSLEIARRLAVRAATLGDLRARVSRGARFGEALGVAIPGLVNAPADPVGFLEEALEARLIVLVAHGYVEPPLEAELLLLEADGREVRLSLQTIAKDPRRIVDKTFILLSCETGRTGTWTHQAGGLAGALLSCGARRVIAPLWPVVVDPAIAVGEALLVGLVAKQDPARILADIGRIAELADGPTVSTSAFVVWS